MLLCLEHDRFFVLFLFALITQNCLPNCIPLTHTSVKSVTYPFVVTKIKMKRNK